MTKKHFDYVLLGLLSLLWGSSYLFIKIALQDIPPLSLIAMRVFGAALFLIVIVQFIGQKLPNDFQSWKRLFIQSIFNSTGAWTLLAWGQQFVPAGLATVLNSTAPLFVLLVSLLLNFGSQSNRKIYGAILGFLGVTFIVSQEAFSGNYGSILGQLACLMGAVLYACAALYGSRLSYMHPIVTAAGTLICASALLIPAALIIEQPWTLSPSYKALVATATLSIFCTGVALVIYFRLVNNLGSLGVSSQAYLRVGIGVLLSVIILNETISASQLTGLISVMVAVAMINWPRKASQ